MLQLTNKQEQAIANFSLTEGSLDVNADIRQVMGCLMDYMRGHSVLAGTIQDDLAFDGLFELFGDTPINVQLSFTPKHAHYFITHQKGSNGPRLKVLREKGKTKIEALNQEGINLLLLMHSGGARSLFRIFQDAKCVYAESEAAQGGITPIEKYMVLVDRATVVDGGLFTDHDQPIFCDREELAAIILDPSYSNIRVTLDEEATVV